MPPIDNPIGVLITGGDFQALGVLRTLARKGIPVVVLDSDHCIGRYSRYASKCHRAPALCNHEAYTDFLLDLAHREHLDGWVIFPNSDEAVGLLSKKRDVLTCVYRLTTPPWEVIQNVQIKKNTYKLAEKHNIPIPKTCYPENVEELASLELKYPVVLKPSIRDNFYNKFRKKAFRIDNREQLFRMYQKICSVIDPSEVLVQDFIPGGPVNLFSFCPFFKEGTVVAGITARRSRQHPMEFGQASTFAETVDIPDLKHIAETFLRLIGYYGIGEVEFMYDERSDEYKLLEVNPRVWGWHTLAIAAGVDLPYMLYQDMMGQEITLPTSPNHAKWVRMATDIPTALIEIVTGRMPLRDYLHSMKGKKEYAVFSWDDPLPSLAELVMMPYLWKKRGFL